MKVIKILKIFGLAYIAFLMTACNSGAEFKQLRQDFAFPSAEFKTAPNWVWNGIVTEAIIDAQLEDYYQHGIGGVFVQTSYGLNTEYASDDWYELVAYAMKKARSLNMELWPCIENTYPASIKGELPTETMFSARNGVHALRLHRQSKLDPDTAKSYLYIFKGHNDVTDKVDSLRGKRGDFLLWEKVNYPVDEFQTGYSYFDLIKPGMTEELIELTMSGYEEKIGMEFGSAVPGINTTEPHIAPFGEEGLIRWTADLSEQFEKRWGYDPGPHLISLLENKGDYKTVRHNYYQLMLELFIDRWSIPWHKYAEKNKLQWSGNYWEHTWPSPNKVPDNMALYAWHQVPGIDMMFNNWDAHPDEFGNIRAVRELNSVSNQLGKKRKLGKTYASSGWELTFEDMKRNGDWEYVLGVNMMSQHLSFQNLPGERNHVHPP